MDIKTKYNFGDHLYCLSYRSKKHKIPNNCSTCKDTGKVKINDEIFTCPKCRGYTYETVNGETEWYLSDNGIVGSIRTEQYASQYLHEYGRENEINYMLDKTGIGSGTVWKERNLFNTPEEAEIEIQKRNNEIRNITVYTDGTHLVCRNIEKLHEFAQSIELQKEWFQDHRYKHYDLTTKRMKDKANKKGAVLVSSKELINILKQN